MTTSTASTITADLDRFIDTPEVSHLRADTVARVIWAQITEPGDVTAGVLIQSLGARQALDVVLGEADEPDTVPLDLGTLRERARSRFHLGRVLDSLTVTARRGFHLITPNDEAWPAGFADLGATAPYLLWVHGDPALLGSKTISLGGARAATGYGENMAMELSAGLVDLGYTIVSGAAYGIDGMCHRSALASGGKTIAFVAGGVDRHYPAGHDALLTRISEAGAVVSERPPAATPTRYSFLQRNRLIAAVSPASVIVEAGFRSGSLGIASHAVDLGRGLGAVPGPVTSAASAGCHRLLREFDAVCITTAEEAAQL